MLRNDVPGLMEDVTDQALSSAASTRDVPAASDVITVFLADDNLLVREGVRALLSLESDLDIVGVAADYDELIAGATELSPQVLVTDIRMPPTFQDEGIEAAKEIRKRHPGTGVVVLSQYDEPEYAISLLSDGAAGYAYLLKDRVSDGNRLARAIRDVATGGSMLDPEIVEALVSPAKSDADLTASQTDLLEQVAQGRPVKAIAAASGSTPESVNAAIEGLFLHLRRERAPARSGRFVSSVCSRRRSSTARSRARPSAACFPAAWPRSCATTGTPSDEPSDSRSRC